MTDRSSLTHYAKALLAQSRHFTRRQRGFSFVLLGWAGNARRRLSKPAESQAPDMQLSLF